MMLSSGHSEQTWDKKLHIDTCGLDRSSEDYHHFPYEPTPYSVLEQLAESGWIRKENVLLDYGCGKGRTGIFLSDRIGCRSVGIDFNEDFIEAARDNLARYARARQGRHAGHTGNNGKTGNAGNAGNFGNAGNNGKTRNAGNAGNTGNAGNAGHATPDRIAFFHANAERYPVPDEIDRFYFFNPFTVNVLQSVIGRILESWYRSPRHILLMFYYPSDEFVSCLMGIEELTFWDEIDCSELFPGDGRERILCFETARQHAEEPEQTVQKRQRRRQ